MEKKIYPFDKDTLLQTPEKLFCTDVLQLVPAAQYDIEQLGRCLAFEIPTGAAIHLYRILAHVMYGYWENITKKSSPLLCRDIDIYVQELEKMKTGNGLILSAILSAFHLYPNPLSYPTHSFSMEEAIEFYGIINSLIGKMCKEIIQTLINEEK
jgi:hypothetical protein